MLLTQFLCRGPHLHFSAYYNLFKYHESLYTQYLWKEHTTTCASCSSKSSLRVSESQSIASVEKATRNTKNICCKFVHERRKKKYTKSIITIQFQDFSFHNGVYLRGPIRIHEAKSEMLLLARLQVSCWLNLHATIRVAFNFWQLFLAFLSAILMVHLFNVTWQNLKQAKYWRVLVKCLDWDLTLTAVCRSLCRVGLEFSEKHTQRNLCFQSLHLKLCFVL